jgi:hypothetical protein
LKVVQSLEVVDIRVIAEPPPAGQLCLAGFFSAPAEVVLMPEQRAASVTIVFRQPDGADSVRTITHPPAAP